VALRAVCLLLVGSVDGHHAGATGSDVRVVHWRQLHARLIVNLTLADIRTVQYVVIIVKAHQSVLLLANLLLLEVSAALAFVALHLLAHIAAAVLHQIGLRDVSVALRVRRGHTLAHAVVLRHITPLLRRAAVHPVVILFSLSAILRI